tara:strand:+ start:76 stop:792 length:717 start_codon:yes stop_codon:yes gene_type:complete
MSTLSDLLIATPKYQITIPSTKEKTSFRPFLVKEEKILLLAQEGNDPDNMVMALQSLIESCVDGIDDASKMPLFDIEFLFLRIRAKSVSEEVNPIIICPETGEEIEIKVNLSNIEIKHTDGHTNKIKITDDLNVYMKYPSLALLKERSTGIDYTSPSSFYDLIADCIEKIETKEETIDTKGYSREELTNFVDNMTKEQFEKLLDFFVTSPRVEHIVKYRASDEVEREVVLSGLSDFFG